MKRWMIISLLALLLAALCGCSRLVPSSYTLVTPHDAGAKSEPQSDVLTVRDYKTLKNALRTLVQNGVEHGVNHTLGLPFVRTSPDHGTAFDIAGRGQADHHSLLAAVAAAKNQL